MNFFKIVAEEHDSDEQLYSETVMRTAYACTISLAFISGFGWMYRKFYNAADCESAHLSSAEEKMLSVRKMSRTELSESRLKHTRGGTLASNKVSLDSARAGLINADLREAMNL